jgi:hypothetical protein
MVAKPMLASHNVVGKCEHFKNIDLQDTQNVRNLQARHLNALLSFERLGRLIDSEIMGTANYKALDLL